MAKTALAKGARSVGCWGVRRWDSSVVTLAAGLGQAGVDGLVAERQGWDVPEAFDGQTPPEGTLAGEAFEDTQQQTTPQAGRGEQARTATPPGGQVSRVGRQVADDLLEELFDIADDRFRGEAEGPHRFHDAAP
jgi:hypothetical protein